MKKLISFILCLVTVVSVIPMGTMAQENPFPDVPADAWYAQYIVKANEMGLMQGNEKGEMMPTKPITRAEAVTIIRNNCTRIYDYPEVTEIPFTDVKKSDWFYDAVKWAYCEGVAQGVGNNKFKPNDYVTREDFAVMICNYYGLSDSYQASYRNEWYFYYNHISVDNFKDKDLISEYAQCSVAWLSGDIGTGEPYTANSIYPIIMEGTNGYIMPKNTCARGEAAKIMYMIAVESIYNPFHYVYNIRYPRYYEIPYAANWAKTFYEYQYGVYWRCEWNKDNSGYAYPNKLITRKELYSAVVSALLDADPNGGSLPNYTEYSFVDCQSKYVEYAYRNGYILSKSKYFRPNEYATREELIYLLYRASKLKGSDNIDTSKYSDFNTVSDDYKDAIRWYIGLLNKYEKLNTIWSNSSQSSNGMIGPKEYVTRRDVVLFYGFNS